MRTKRNYYQLKINEPCTINWSKMEDQDFGKFCKVCRKNVYDLTSYSDNELIKIIENSKDGICGKLRVDQINRKIFETNKHKTNYFKWVASFVLLLMSKTTFSATKTENKSTIQQDSTHPEKTDSTHSEKIKLIGYAYDSISHYPLAFGTAILKGTKIGTKLDSNGRFELIVPDSLSQESYEVEIKFLGHIKKTILWKTNETKIIKTVYLSINTKTVTIGLIVPTKNE